MAGNNHAHSSDQTSDRQRRPTGNGIEIPETYRLQPYACTGRPGDIPFSDRRHTSECRPARSTAEQVGTGRKARRPAWPGHQSPALL